MPNLNFKTRILQVIGLIVLSLFVAEFTQWQQGLWIAVSITAIIGPFSPSLTLEKARNRIIGTVAGLLLATLLEIFLRYNYQVVFIVSVLWAYLLGFTAQQNYRLFIMFVTVAVCLNYEYMNLPFTSFEPITFLVARFIAVLIGIALFLFVQKYIYGDNNARQELAESTRDLIENFLKGISEYLNPDEVKKTSSLDLAMELTEKSKSFRELLAASHYGMSQSSVEMSVAKKVDRIRARIIRLLLDNAFIETNNTSLESPILSANNSKLLRIKKLSNKICAIEVSQRQANKSTVY